MRLHKTPSAQAAISLVAMVDVLMILLVFFMVTSTYLDLDMVPLAGGPEVSSEGGTVAEAGLAKEARLLIRLGADGRAHVRGQALPLAALGTLLSERLAAAPALDVIVLPSAQANVQALAALMDVAVAAGAQRLRIVRLEAAP